jgi:hypothetical protein
MSAEDLIRKAYAAYLARGRKTFEEILSDDFVSTSLWDDHIDKVGYLERCWEAAIVSPISKSRNFSRKATRRSSAISSP